MTKREQLTKKVKEAIQDTYWTDTIIAKLGFMHLNCRECPCRCVYRAEYDNDCFTNLYQWLEEHGDEEVEE